MEIWLSIICLFCIFFIFWKFILIIEIFFDNIFITKGLLWGNRLNWSWVSVWFLLLLFLLSKILFGLIFLFLFPFSQFLPWYKLPPVLIKALHFREGKNNIDFILNIIILISERNNFQRKLKLFILSTFYFSFDRQSLLDWLSYCLPVAYF